MAIIQTKTLKLIIQGKTILYGLDLAVDSGEFFVLIGPTGAGKTSLLKILDLLEYPTSGSIFIGGTDAVSSSRTRLELRRRMAFVQQKPTAFNVSVFDNVACGLRWRRIEPKLIKDRVDKILEMVGLSGYQKQNARTLSGGEMQRVAIARALIIQPEILYLDEPTANLDPISTCSIEALLERIKEEARITVVMSTHDMYQGQRLAQRMGVMMNGRLLQVGTSRDIFNTPKSREVAEFVGIDNIWCGKIAGKDGNLASISINDRIIQAVTDLEMGAAVEIMIRPEEITLALSSDHSSTRNVFSGIIVSINPFGPLTHITLDCGFPVLGLVTQRSAEKMELKPGKTIYASFNETALHVIRK